MPLPVIINPLAVVLGALALASGPTLADVTVATTQELKVALGKAELTKAFLSCAGATSM